jgi:hypothetical protein
VRRYQPLSWRLRRFFRRAGRWLSSKIAIGFIVGVISSVLAGVLLERAKVYFSERDMATIEVTAKDRTIREFGVVQVWQVNSRIEQHRFGGWNSSTVAFRVAPGAYEVRLYVLGKPFLLGTQTLTEGAPRDTRTPTSDLPTSFRTTNLLEWLPARSLEVLRHFPMLRRRTKSRCPHLEFGRYP